MDACDTINRRRHDRFLLDPMYTNVTVHRGPRDHERQLAGHAYDLSECGVRIELDEPLVPGERVDLHLGLPGEDGDVLASAQVIWVLPADDDPGPRRTALCFREFLSDGDRARLHRFLGSGICRRAA